MTRDGSLGGVAVLVLDLDHSEGTIRAVESVMQQSGGAVSSVHVLINGSSESHRSRLLERLAGLDRVHIHESSVNLGFAGGINYLVRRICSSPPVPEFLLLLNNDATVEADTIEILARVLGKDSAAGIAGPRILRSGTDRIIADDGAATISWLMQQRFTGAGKPDTFRARTPPRPVPFVSGACMMVRSGLFARLGGFNEEFFAYFEDWDFCLRAARIGFECRHVSEALAWHGRLGSNGRRMFVRQFLMTRNRYLMAEKHLHPAVRSCVFFPYYLVVRICFKMVQQLLLGRIAEARGTLQGLAWLLVPVNFRRRLWPVPNSRVPGAGGPR